jgi:hypothetical protein
VVDRAKGWVGRKGSRAWMHDNRENRGDMMPRVCVGLITRHWKERKWNYDTQWPQIRGVATQL